MKKLIYSTSREGYGVDQINRTMTAGELINFLAQYDEDTPIYLSFDNGYTYGGIVEGRFEENYGEDNDDEYCAARCPPAEKPISTIRPVSQCHISAF